LGKAAKEPVDGRWDGEAKELNQWQLGRLPKNPVNGRWEGEAKELNQWQLGEEAKEFNQRQGGKCGQRTLISAN
jgi:hypothetical protein